MPRSQHREKKAVKKPKKALANSEQAAIDAMLSLGSKCSSDSEETDSTASLSSMGSNSLPSKTCEVPVASVKVPQFAEPCIHMAQV
jgi:hypothetical protein